MVIVLCHLFSYIVEAVILWQYTSNLFIAKHQSNKRIRVLCSLYMILFSALLFDSKWLNAVLYLLANFIFLITQFDLKWHLAFFHSAILSAVMAMCELMVYCIIQCFTPHFLANIEYAYNAVVFAIFSKITFFTIIYIIIQISEKKQSYSKKYDKSTLLLIFIPITSVFIMLTFICISDTYTLSHFLNWMITLGAFLLLAINLLVFGINQYNQKKTMEFTEMQLLLQKESDSAKYYEMLRLQYENQRILIHDIKKHLHSINTLNEQKDHDKIAAYIHQLIRSSELKESARLCDNNMLNSILSRYEKQCTDHHIAFHVDIRSGTTNFISNNDLTSLFCNLLDNAVEACCNLSESFIEIHTTNRENTPFVVITLINSCRQDPFSKKTGKLLTTKPKKHMHGFGIKSIRKTIGKYHGDMQMYYNQDTATFHTIITLKSEPMS